MKKQKVKKIFAVVVTYNRLEKLKLCIEAIQKQEKQKVQILVINNASTDATSDYLSSQEGIQHIDLPRNIGGAGGFKTGMVKAIKEGAEYIWIMDDDVVPDKNALENLVSFCIKHENVGFVASAVYDLNGYLMNVPTIKYSVGQNEYSQWGKYLDEGAISIKKATFVSLLIPRKTIKKIGYPYQDFFIWGDDSEYTLRISEIFESYLVGTSKVIHDRVQTSKLLPYKEIDSNRVKNLSYLIRNNIFIARKYTKINLLLQVIQALYFALLSVMQPGPKFARTFQILKGTFLGLFFIPEK